MKNENVKEETKERTPIEPLSEGIYTITGVFYNSKSKFLPSYLLFTEDGRKISASQYASKQIDQNLEYFKQYVVEIETKKAHSKKYDKDFYKIVRIKKIRDNDISKMKSNQIKLEGF